MKPLPFLLLALRSVSAAQDGPIDWRGDYATGMKEAKDSNKLVLLYFTKPG